MPTYALGRLKQHDPRSLAYPATTSTLRSVTWRHYGTVLDQGQTGSCTGNAMAQALNSQTLLQKRRLTEDDARNLYSAATKIDGIDGEWPPTDTGSSGLAVAKAAQQAGYISGYTHAFGIDHVLAALMVGPLIVGTTWTNDMFTPTASGQVRPTGSEAGGHEYLLRGYSASKKRVGFLQSWGQGWGNNGRFWMTVDDFADLLAAGGDAVAPRPLA